MYRLGAGFEGAQKQPEATQRSKALRLLAGGLAGVGAGVLTYKLVKKRMGYPEQDALYNKDFYDTREQPVVTVKKPGTEPKAKAQRQWEAEAGEEIREGLQDFIWPVRAGRPAISQGFHEGHCAVDIQNQPSQNYPGWTALSDFYIFNGIEFYRGWAVGQPIAAVADGVVSQLSYTVGSNDNNTSVGPGNYIVLAHGNGYFTRYVHMHSISTELKVGSRVAQGNLLGTVGQTGIGLRRDGSMRLTSEGGHLHFEVIFVKNRDGYRAEQDAGILKSVSLIGSCSGLANNGLPFQKLNPKHYLPV